MLTKFLFNHLSFEKKSFRIKGKRFELYLAKGFARKAIGLMHRKSIRQNEGMLFDFPYARKYKIWMLNMKFPLDIIWMDENQKVVHIEKNLQPCSDGMFGCKSYSPSKPAKYVVELSAGMAAKLKISPGEKIDVA